MPDSTPRRPRQSKQSGNLEATNSLLARIWQKRESLCALTEQAMISGVNFLFTVMLLKFAPLETLGVFQMGRFLMLLLAGMQNSLISFPYTIAFRQINPEDPESSKRYACSQLVLAILFCGLTILLIAGCLVYPWDASVFGMLVALLLAAPMFLVREFSRRHEFAHLRAESAMWFSILAAALQIGGLLVLHWRGAINAASAMTVLALSYAITNAIWLAWRYREFEVSRETSTSSADPSEASKYSVANTLKTNWQIGRWIFSSQSLSDLLLTSIHWLITLGVDKTVGGAFAACFQVASLLNPLVMGLTNMLPPRFAKITAEENRKQLYLAASASAKSMLSVLLVISAFLSVASPWLLSILAKEPIANAGLVMFVLVAMMVVQALGIPPFHGLNAMSLPQKTVAAPMIGLIFGIAVFLLLGIPWGAAGAAIALLVGRALVTGVTFWEFRRTAMFSQ